MWLSRPGLPALHQDASPPPGPVPFPTTEDFDNCEQLHPDLSLSWTVNRTSESVKFMLCGCISNDTLVSYPPRVLYV